MHVSAEAYSEIFNGGGGVEHFVFYHWDYVTFFLKKLNMTIVMYSTENKLQK